MVKFHCCTVGVLALAWMPCGANVEQGVGTPGPHDTGSCTSGEIGVKEASAPE